MILNHQRQLETSTSLETLREFFIISTIKANPSLTIVSPMYLLFQFATPKVLSPFSVSCHFPTNILFFIKMLDKPQVLNIPLNYSSLKLLPV